MSSSLTHLGLPEKRPQAMWLKPVTDLHCCGGWKGQHQVAG